MQKIYSLLFMLGLSLPILAQQDLSSHFLRGTWQANLTNPALIPDQNLTISLPGVYNNILLTGITYNELLIEDENGQRVLDVSNAIDNLEEFNFIREDLDIHTIGVGVRLGKLNLTLAHALRFGAYINYPKTLPQLIWEGNSQFIGQEIAFGPDLQVAGYNEFALGAAYQITDNISIGGRVKYLNGVGDVSSQRTDLRLLTDDDIYQLTLTADYLLNSTGTVTYDGLTDLDFDFDFGGFGADSNQGGNTGLAFDLGAQVKIGKLDIAASVLDIGGTIDWEQDIRNYELNGTFEFAGLDIAQDLLDDTTTLSGTLDTLRDSYEVTENTTPYSTNIPTRMYLSATYELNDRLTVGGLFFTERFRDETFTAAALSANFKLLSMLQVGAVYAYRHERFDNLGLNAVLKVGPLQVVAATDNILTAVRLYDSNSANLRLGLNLVFGKPRETNPNKISDQEEFFRKK